MIGVKFMLEGGQFLAVQMSPANFDIVLRGLQDGSAPSFSGICGASGAKWFINAAKVVGCHSFDWGQAVQQAQPAGNFYGRGLSGRN